MAEKTYLENKLLVRNTCLCLDSLPVSHLYRHCTARDKRWGAELREHEQREQLVRQSDTNLLETRAASQFTYTSVWMPCARLYSARISAGYVLKSSVASCTRVRNRDIARSRSLHHRAKNNCRLFHSPPTDTFWLFSCLTRYFARHGNYVCPSPNPRWHFFLHMAENRLAAPPQDGDHRGWEERSVAHLHTQACELS